MYRKNTDTENHKTVVDNNSVSNGCRSKACSLRVTMTTSTIQTWLQGDFFLVNDKPTCAMIFMEKNKKQEKKKESVVSEHPQKWYIYKKNYFTSASPTKICFAS